MLTSTRRSTVHIEPNRQGRWVVRYDDSAHCSEHNSATEAERAARSRMRGEDSVEMLLRDRYGRVHVVTAAGLRD